MTAAAISRSTALVDAGREWGQPLTEADARDLTTQIRTSVEELLPLIRTAYQRRADLALGYASWEAYCDGELVGLRLAVADRQEAVAGLRADGMSTRAIGAALGVNHSTVVRDLRSTGASAPVEKVASLDGRERPATRPTPSPGPTGAAQSPPADPGTTSAPAAEAPVPSQEPGPDLKAKIRADLAEIGAEGMTQAAIGLGFPRGEVADVDLEASIRELVDAGEVLMVGVGHGGAPLWALTESLAGSEYKADPAERIAAVAEVAPEFVQPVEPKPSLTLVPSEDEKRAAEQRDARGLLRRAVEILAPDHDRPGYAATWARQLGPYDAELSDLIRRAAEAIATLDDLIEGCGQ